MSEYQFEAAGTIERIDGILKDWENLFKCSHDASPFISPAWLYPFIKENKFPGKLFVLLVWGKNELAGVLPVSVQKFGFFKIARLISTGLPSYPGVLCDPSSETAIMGIADFMKNKTF